MDFAAHHWTAAEFSLIISIATKARPLNWLTLLFTVGRFYGGTKKKEEIVSANVVAGPANQIS